MVETGNVAADSGLAPITHIKPPAAAAALEHRNLLEGEFWRKIPAYENVDLETFMDWKWQAKHSVHKVSKLLAQLQDLVPQSFYDDVREGFARAPMAVRVSPYVMSLIDWVEPYDDPLRIQFIPVASRMKPDHPFLNLDSLGEKADAPVPGLTHRYPDKALFLPLNTCPVYCRYCTRSYAIGPDTEEVEKFALRVNKERWARAFQYISERPELEDIVISGGDAYQLRPEQIEYIGNKLLEMPNIRRLRFATKGLAIMPNKVLSDHDWLDAITRVVDRGRALHKEVCIHTHFNHANEFTWISRDATNRLMERGITVRNQSVMIRGVNDTVDTMSLLVRRISYYNVHPYYVYTHDMVKGVDELRTTVGTAVSVEKHIRGTTAGFNTPTFVCDAPGGGGKRGVHSYEYYDRVHGVSVYTAPNVKPGQYFCYFDPIDLLPEEGRNRWANPDEHQKIVDEALARAKAGA
jgi:lysine 2,3-aminomutase